ncbi:MAG: hypothetical protein SGARI_006700, partial [Bacillariaceae sp.]
SGFTLKSTVLEAPTTAGASASDTDASLPSNRLPTRFDRLKKNYKGPRNEVADGDLPFSYADFEDAVAKTSYSFERNAIVSGTCIEYANGGCIVDI